MISCQQHPCQQHPCQQHPTRNNGHDPRFDTLDPQYRELIAEPNLENVPIWSLSARSSISPFRKTHFPTSADQNITFSKSDKCASYIALFNHLVELVLFHTSILTSSIAQQKYLENVLFLIAGNRGTASSTVPTTQQSRNQSKRELAANRSSGLNGALVCSPDLLALPHAHPICSRSRMLARSAHVPAFAFSLARSRLRSQRAR